MADSDRGRLLPPNLDDRSWQDMVNQARALIPTYAPQWTDHNASDIGITLIELFAYLVEGLTYRLNQVPEANYVAFLNLLGVARAPATPARTHLTFTSSADAAPVPQGTQAQTPGSETERPIIFETDQRVTILKTNLTTALKISPPTSNGQPARYVNLTRQLRVVPALGASFAIPPAPSVSVAQTVLLCMGFDQQVQNSQFKLQWEFTSPLFDVNVIQPNISIALSYSTAAQLVPTSWVAISTTGASPPIIDGTNGLKQNGDLLFTVPNDWSAQSPTSDWPSASVVPDSAGVDAYQGPPLFWIGLTIRNTAINQAPQLGIQRIGFNSVIAHNALTAAGETLSDLQGGLVSTGAKNQVFSAKFAPFYRREDTDTPYDHVVVQVGGVTWTQVDRFLPGPANVYRIDPVAAQIVFGDYDAAAHTGGGSIPAAGVAITATYRYVAGDTGGNVGAGAIAAMARAIPNITGVTNLSAAFGAVDQEAIDDTKRRGPQLLRVRNRAVSAEDYEALAREASSDVKITRALGPRLHDPSEPPGSGGTGSPWTFGAIDRSRGNVSVVIVPDYGTSVDLPQPSKDLLMVVQSYLDARRTLTTNLAVIGPRYLPITVTVSVVTFQKAINLGLVAPGQLVAQLTDAIHRFFHPVHGGAGGTGWQVGQQVFVSDVFAAIAPPTMLGYISSIVINPAIPRYHFPPLNPAGTLGNYAALTERGFTPVVASPSLLVQDYELVCWDPASTVTEAGPL